MYGPPGGGFRNPNFRGPPPFRAFLSGVPPRRGLGMPPRGMVPLMRPGFGHPGPGPFSSMVSEPNSVRSVKCGELRESDYGEEVEIGGRVQSLRMNRFLILRDETGITQLVAPDERVDLQKRMSKIPLDSYVRVRGEVLLRPDSSRNDRMPTGDIEVLIHDFITVQRKRKTDLEEDGFGSSAKKKKIPGGMKLTTEEIAKAETLEMRSYFKAREQTSGDLTHCVRPGDQVTLCGWVLTKRPPLFVVLKDGHGEIQLVPASTKPEVSNLFKEIRIGEVIFVKGILARRPFGQANSRAPNGMHEVSVVELTRVDKSSPFFETEIPDDPLKADINVEQDGHDQSGPESVTKSDEALVKLVNKYTERTHTCGELRAEHVGLSVTLMGWVEFIRLTKFVTLRDGYGSTQILVSDSDTENNKLLNNLSLESIIKVTGTVCARPPNQVKHDLATGDVEVLVSNITVLNKANKHLPFSIRDFKKAKESLRLEHRYLDLRFKEVQNNLRLRSSVLMKMREFLIHHLEFVEIETPTLFKRTPGGAREFVVPTHQPGLFYSLVQSPQQLKQLLMVGAMDRYFQIARCYRDETTRPDRQPEFTQLDIELSFCGQEDVMNLIEDLLKHCWPSNVSIVTPFPRMTYAEAMDTYGSDKPDLRFDWKMVNLTEDFTNGAVDDSKVNIKEKAQEEDFAVYSVLAERGMMIHTGTLKKSTEEQMKVSYPLTSHFLLSGKSIDGRLQLLFGSPIAAAVNDKIQIKDDDIVFIALGSKTQVQESVGKFRLLWADQMESRGRTVRPRKSELKFLWVTDFPLFVTGENSKLQSNHHPFTAPKPGDTSLVFSDPLKVTGLHYDLVLNGSEVGGGSIRIHDGNLQERVLREVLELPTDCLEHLIEALKSGAPPHGGIALGLDRLIALMVGANSIRDVIAFPKSVDGKDPLTGAPSPITDEELQYYHLQKPTTNVT